jgi:hypothetical protein
LRQVFRQLPVARLAKEKPEQRTLMPIDQFIKRAAVPLLETEHQLIVGFGQCFRHAVGQSAEEFLKAFCSV